MSTARHSKAAFETVVEAHRLASPHDASNRRVFDSVVVVTDHVVLDLQLQDTIYQFEHKRGRSQIRRANDTMAFDEKLAQRVRKALARRLDVEERKMFGGLAFLIRGHMCCGVESDRLMVRVRPEEYDRCLALPHVREMDFTGRPLRGFVYVEPPGLVPQANLKSWVDRGVAFAASVPAKAAKRAQAAKPPRKR